ncbi:hypothetical protein E0Z06_04440 [Rheinheimera sp. D18]|uniref:hypothetical protein n=1 Tax=Rheinheimera sp. D18 TaxID=2545632 RepID=UPI0010441878|nr:hypothetical protein [Rheinheimera sp. D18]QBL08813.1 hypothetical protein E0Z06_04440 [Rheinheimera sp. D18]
MQQQELNKLMHDSATDAVSYAKEQHKIALNNSIASLEQIDNLISELHQLEKQQRHSTELVFTLSNILGAYVGEVFIANVGGQWQHNQTDTAAPFIFVQFNDKEFPFASVCYHKITRDNSISLHDYVKQAMANAMQ